MCKFFKKLAVIGLLLPGLISDIATAQESAFIAPSGTRAIPAEQTAASWINPDWLVPRTSWGHPDLQGVWTSDDMRSVNRERPERFANRKTLTAEEFAERSENDEDSLDRAVNEETFSGRSEWGIRSFAYTSLIIEPSNGRMPQMTAAGLARAASRDRGTFGAGPFDTVEDFTLYDRCITRGIVGSVLPVIYGNGLRIVQTPDSVVISYEMIHDTRIIPLDGRPYLSEDIRQYLGNSRGYWDGDTLVVETRNLTDKTSIGGNGNGIRHSAEMKITEWFTRTDEEMIDYLIRVEDPITYEEPFTLRLTITTQPDYVMYEYSCHEGNGAVANTLNGDRAYDRKVAEAIAQGLPVPEPRSASTNRFGGLGIPGEGVKIYNINAGE